MQTLPGKDLGCFEAGVWGFVSEVLFIND
jgi:hypothetical protein